MPALQAIEKSATKQAQKRRSPIAGWLVIFSISLVGINVAKQHIRETFGSSANGSVLAQPQGILHKNAANYGTKWGRKREVSEPTSIPTNARATDRENTIIAPYLPQGGQQQAQAFRAETSRTEEVRFGENSYGTSTFWNYFEELATPREKNGASSPQTIILPIYNRASLDPSTRRGNAGIGEGGNDSVGDVHAKVSQPTLDEERSTSEFAEEDSEAINENESEDQEEGKEDKPTRGDGTQNPENTDPSAGTESRQDCKSDDSPDNGGAAAPVHRTKEESTHNTREGQQMDSAGVAGAVSYTHLTLPTIYSV